MDQALKDLAKIIGKDEKVLWFAKPDKRCFVLESIFNPLLGFAFFWFLIDMFALAGIIATNDKNGMLFAAPFFLIHLMPVWIYISCALTSFIRYKNTAYIITTKGIYISSGLISRTQEMKPFTDLSHVNIHRGIFDQILGVGDVVSTCAHETYGSRHRSSIGGFAICNIPDYEKVFNMVKELQTDIYSDTMFPNALRPENNPGYNTQYNKFPERNFDNQ